MALRLSRETDNQARLVEECEVDSKKVLNDLCRRLSRIHIPALRNTFHAIAP